MSPRFGNAGYCKVCRFEHEAQINDKLKAGFNARQINDYARDKWGFTATRQTWYAHKEHLKAPQNAIVAAAEEGRSRLPAVRNATSNKEFLEAVRDIGFTRALTDPESVSMEHALKASSILEQSKNKSTDITLVLAQVVTGHRPDVVIEGTATEV